MLDDLSAISLNQSAVHLLLTGRSESLLCSGSACFLIGHSFSVWSDPYDLSGESFAGEHVYHLFVEQQMGQTQVAKEMELGLVETQLTKEMELGLVEEIYEQSYESDVDAGEHYLS